MPVSVFLTPEQLDVVKAANKDGKVDVKTTTNSLQLTHENWQAVRDAVQALHTKKFTIKTKTVENLETCYYCSQVLEKIQGVSMHFITTKPPVPANDGEIGTVTTEETTEETETSQAEETETEETEIEVTETPTEAKSDGRRSRK